MADPIKDRQWIIDRVKEYAEESGGFTPGEKAFCTKYNESPYLWKRNSFGSPFLLHLLRTYKTVFFSLQFRLLF